MEILICSAILAAAFFILPTSIITAQASIERRSFSEVEARFSYYEITRIFITVASLLAIIATWFAGRSAIGFSSVIFVGIAVQYFNDMRLLSRS